MIPFYSWLKSYRREYSQVGDFARKILKERKISKIRKHNRIRYYLKSTKNFNKKDLQLFEKTYTKYQLEVL